MDHFLNHTPITRYRTFYTLAEAAEELRVSIKTVRRRIADGTIRAVWIGGAQRIPHSELTALVVGSVHHGVPAVRRRKDPK